MLLEFITYVISIILSVFYFSECCRSCSSMRKTWSTCSNIHWPPLSISSWIFLSDVMNSSESIFNNISTASKQLEPCSILRPLGYYLILLWIVGTTLNGAVLFVFIRYKKLRQSSTNIFIGGLLLADFIGACFEIPLPAIALLSCRYARELLWSGRESLSLSRWIFTYVGCVFESVVAYFAGCSNMYMLCLISIDRWEKHRMFLCSYNIFCCFSDISWWPNRFPRRRSALNKRTLPSHVRTALPFSGRCCHCWAGHPTIMRWDQFG